MRKLEVPPPARLVEAEWLATRLHSFGSGVVSIVPDEFPAYIRVLHPARGRMGEPVRWADVAAASGRTMHRLVEFDEICSSLSTSGIDPFSWNNRPQSGNLSADLLIALCAVLAGHTSTRDYCWFCLWEGYGWLQDSQAGWTFFAGNRGKDSVPRTKARPPRGLPPEELLRAPRVHLPQRDYLLLKGPSDAATELGWNLTEECFVPQSPNLFWPQDHAWCVASEIDLLYTLVAGSETLADALIADPHFEAWRVFPRDFTWDRTQNKS